MRDIKKEKHEGSQGHSDFWKYSNPFFFFFLYIKKKKKKKKKKSCSAITLKMVSGSAILPVPNSPQLKCPISGPTITMPSA